jgi:hypothetical protein
MRSGRERNVPLPTVTAYVATYRTLTIIDEHTLRVLGNRVLRKIIGPKRKKEEQQRSTKYQRCSLQFLSLLTNVKNNMQISLRPPVRTSAVCVDGLLQGCT